MNVVAAIVEVAGDGETVAAVVARAAEDFYLCGIVGEELIGQFGGDAGDVLHQHYARYVIFLDGDAVDGAGLQTS